MKTITSTELARSLREALDPPAPGRQTALEAMADLYRTLPDSAAEGWAEGTRGMLAGEVLPPL